MLSALQRIVATVSKGKTSVMLLICPNCLGHLPMKTKPIGFSTLVIIIAPKAHLRSSAKEPTMVLGFASVLVSRFMELFGDGNECVN